MSSSQESSLLSLPPGRVDLWFASVETAVARGRIAVYRDWLPADEVARADRYRQERDRNCCLVARALVRSVLSGYTGHDPAAWTFRYNAHGKPSILQPAGLSLHFNVSHTSGLVICGVASAGELGVDVERLSRGCSCLDLARRFFAGPEIAFLEKTSPERQPGVFLEFWTLKEAYIKARGLGLAMPLAEFAFTLADPQAGVAAGANDPPPVIRFLRGDHGEAEEWRFAQFRLCGDYQAAVALHLPSRQDLVVRVRERCP
jgi:4'-phosphopantetheinyl transferase